MTTTDNATQTTETEGERTAREIRESMKHRGESGGTPVTALQAWAIR